MNPHFYRLRKRDRREGLLTCPERVTERCERDFLRLVFRVGNSNEIRQRTAKAVPSNRLNNWETPWREHRKRAAAAPPQKHQPLRHVAPDAGAISGYCSATRSTSSR